MYHLEELNLDGLGYRKTRVYNVQSLSRDYWESVTDVPCHISKCDGLVRW